MAIWFKTPTLDDLNDLGSGNMLEHLGIRFTAIGDDSLSGSMPVDKRTTQPFGILHGGASVVLAETLASMASTLTVNPDSHYAVGLDVNANHIRAIREGEVKGVATPIHIGRTTQVWQVRVFSQEKLASIHRVTMAVIAKR